MKTKPQTIVSNLLQDVTTPPDCHQPIIKVGQLGGYHSCRGTQYLRLPYQCPLFIRHPSSTTRNLDSLL